MTSDLKPDTAPPTIHDATVDEWGAAWRHRDICSREAFADLAARAYRAGMEDAAKVCEQLEFADMTDADEQRYVSKFCRGHEIPMGFHADRLAAAIRAHANKEPA